MSDIYIYAISGTEDGSSVHAVQSELKQLSSLTSGWHAILTNHCSLCYMQLFLQRAHKGHKPAFSIETRWNQSVFYFSGNSFFIEN